MHGRLRGLHRAADRRPPSQQSYVGVESWSKMRIDTAERLPKALDAVEKKTEVYKQVDPIVGNRGDSLLREISIAASSA